MLKLARIAAFALVVMAPLTASATARPVDAHHESKGDLSPGDLRKIVEKRMSEMRARVEKEMGKQAMPESKRAEVRKELDVAGKEVKTALDKAAADGVITKDEAKQVKAAANHFKDLVKKQIPKGKRRAKK